MDKHTIELDGHNIAYYRTGVAGGAPVLLAHGFTGSAHKDFIDQGWFDLLVEQGRDVVALDHLGHGASDKPEGDASLYTPAAHAARMKALADHLGWQAFDLIGHSMGGRISIAYALAYPNTINHLTLVGVGLNVLSADFLSPGIIKMIEMMIATEADDLPKEMQAWHRLLMAESQSLPALLSCAQGIALEAVDLTRVIPFDRPTMVVQGLDDPIGAGADRLAAMFKARHVAVAGADHDTIRAHPTFKNAVLDFWQT